MAIETCEKHAVEGVGRVAERASIRDDNRRIVYSQGRKIAWSKKWPKSDLKIFAEKKSTSDSDGFEDLF